jgi:class 3 adenylate cyclase/tetratricopeptide (TPR) repeat protein
VLFCDVVGSTSMAERLDPEDWIEIINEAFDLLLAPILRYDGTVAQLAGDGFLAFFGAPDAHEDDPERAVLAGLEMIRAIEPLRQRVAATHRFDFSVRVGINTGEVVVGMVGTGPVSSYTVIGDTVNVAARMEQTAEPGTVRITDATRRLLDDRFEVEALGEVEVRGKREPVTSFRVLGVNNHPLPVEEKAGGISPLIGREAEYDLLRTAAIRARSGQGQVISLVGDAGLGKSRLISELRADWEQAAAAATWFECRGVSYDSFRPYGLFRQLLARQLALTSEPAPEVLQDRIMQRVGGLPPARRQAVTRAFERLFAIAEFSDDVESTAETLKRDLFSAMTDWWRGSSAHGPLALVFDDLHWADSASAELLLSMLPLVASSPILLVCASRPEIGSPVGELEREARRELPDAFISVGLQPLSDEASARLIEQLSAGAELSPDLQGAVLQKTEGNPFFIEELTQALIEQAGRINGNATGGEGVSVPGSIQAVLTARIDRLAPPTRRTLQLASVIGRQFAVEVLRSLAEPAVDLADHLQQLRRADLVGPEPGMPEPTYAFRHELTRESAYASILRRERRELHRRVGDVIERLAGQRADDVAHRLVYHFEIAGERPRVVDYALLAGDVARRMHAMTEALAMYERALGAARDLDDPRIAEIRLRCGQSWALLGSFDKAHNFLTEALERAKADGSSAIEQAALYELAGLFTSTDYKMAESVAVRALELASTGDDRRSEGLALNRLGNILSNQLRFAEGRALHDRALEIFESLGDRWGTADSLDLIGMTQFLAGEFIASRRTFSRAIEIFRQLNDRERLASSLTARGSYAPAVEGACQTDVSPSECRKDAFEALELCREMKWRAGESFALTMIGSCELGQARFGAAYRFTSEALMVAHEIDHPQWKVLSLLMRGLVHLELDDYDSAAQHFTEAHAIAVSLSSPMWIERNSVLMLVAQRTSDDASLSKLRHLSVAPGGSTSIGTRMATLTLAQRLCERDQFEEALTVVAQLVSDEHARVPPAVSLLRGRALAGQGDHAAADLALLEARNVAETVGPRTYLWRIAAARAELLSQLDQRVSDRERQIARAEVEKIAASIENGPIRRRFETSEGVRTLSQRG